jgi:hypothetical protein
MRFLRLFLILGSLIVVTGMSLAIAEPTNAMAAPFRGIAIKALEATPGLMGLFKDARTVTATHEYSIIQQALQVMMLDENIEQLPVVATTTSDMSKFPSPGHALYPTYLEGKNSEFSYTIDSKGELTVDEKQANVDPALARILDTIQKVERGEKVLADKTN